MVYFLRIIMEIIRFVENRGINMTLNQLPIGKEAVITKVGGEGALRCRLLDMGLIPKTKVTITKVAPMGDPIELRLRGYTLTIRMDDARNIEIAEEGNA